MSVNRQANRPRGRVIAPLLVSLLLAGVGTAAAEVSQKGNLRVALSGNLSPKALPRSGAAPVSVSVAGRISTINDGSLPQLRTLTIDLNRHGRLDYTGLPTCAVRDIQPATTAKALDACRDALVGDGTFSANILLKGLPPYPTTGRLLVFNGKEGHHQILLGQIYTSQPFTNSFVIIFRIAKVKHGAYGTSLVASLPRTLGNWGYVTGIDMTLSRRYSYRGDHRSYISAGCPAPKGFSRVNFKLARASFDFADGRKISSTLVRSCRPRG